MIPYDTKKKNNSNNNQINRITKNIWNFLPKKIRQLNDDFFLFVNQYLLTSFTTRHKIPNTPSIQSDKARNISNYRLVTAV